MIKKLFFLLCSLFLLFGGVIYQKNFKKSSPRTKFKAGSEKAFVIIIPSYNNSAYIEKNLSSVFSQNYCNYRVIYIDDNSSDNTLEKARELLEPIYRKMRTTLVHNPTNQGALANIYSAVHSCLDEEIAVIVDGDDFLAHENVLKIVNEAYADPNTWVTCGSYMNYPYYTKSVNPFKKERLRKGSVEISPLHSFYAGLFKQISLEDLFYRGRFYQMNADIAYMIPILEMAPKKVQYIEDILYLYNRENPICDRKINKKFQEICASHIQSKRPYKPLEKFPTKMLSLQDKADVLIFSENRPEELGELLDSLKMYVRSLGKMQVLYEAKDYDMDAEYLELKLGHPEIAFFKKQQNFKQQVVELGFKEGITENTHIVFATDKSVITDSVDLSEAINTLNETKAYGFYFDRHKEHKYSSDLQRALPIPPFHPLKRVLSHQVPFAFQFSAGVDDWASPASLDFALFSKKNLEPLLKILEFDSIESLKAEWTLAESKKKIGLFYSKPKSVKL